MGADLFVAHKNPAEQMLRRMLLFVLIVDDKPAAARSDCKLQTALEAGFVQHVRDMLLDAAFRDAEFCRDFRIGLAADQSAQHVQLAFRQAGADRISEPDLRHL